MVIVCMVVTDDSATQNASKIHDLIMLKKLLIQLCNMALHYHELCAQGKNMVNFE